MGCGKSKHAVVTETTIIKSTKSDDGKETRKTKTVTEKGDSISVQEVETTSSVVEDTKKETTTTKVDPTGATAAANAGASVAPASADEHDKVVNDDDVDVVKAVKEDEEVKDSNPSTDPADVAPASDEGVTEVVKDDEKKESTTTTTSEEKEATTENVGPTLMENVTPATLVVKDEKRFKDSKEEMVYETPMKTTDEFSNTEFTTPKVQEQRVFVPTKESIKVETKKEEDVESATESKKVPTTSEANVAETKEKETSTK